MLDVAAFAELACPCSQPGLSRDVTRGTIRVNVNRYLFKFCVKGSGIAFTIIVQGEYFFPSFKRVRPYSGRPVVSLYRTA